MTRANIKATLPHPAERVWEMVTSLTDYSWRSDISKIEILSETEFIEYTKNGYPTRFAITVKEPCHLYEFDMENGNMRGHWTGEFSAHGEHTAISFTELISAKKWFMKPFVGLYLSRQQSAYLKDLKKALG